MSRLIVLVLLLPLQVFALAKQNISVCYFDQEQVSVRIPNPPYYMKHTSKEDVERGFMLFYERRLFDVSLFSCYLGCDVGKWAMSGDHLYTTSAFLTARMWFLHLFHLHPYAEYSVFGPTLLSQEKFADIDFQSNLLFQNFFSVGVEVGEDQGFSLSMKMFKYTKKDLSSFEESFQVPILVSAGFLF